MPLSASCPDPGHLFLVYRQVLTARHGPFIIALVQCTIVPLRRGEETCSFMSTMSRRRHSGLVSPSSCHGILVLGGGTGSKTTQTIYLNPHEPSQACLPCSPPLCFLIVVLYAHPYDGQFRPLSVCIYPHHTRRTKRDSPPENSRQPPLLLVCNNI